MSDVIVSGHDWRDLADYDDLHQAARERAEELQITRESIDWLGRLPERYAGKLLAPTKIKHMGVRSLFPIIRALGLRLILVKDAEAAERIKASVRPRVEHQVRRATAQAEEDRHG